MEKQFDPMKPCKTRDGREARIYATDGDPKSGEIHGAIMEAHAWQIAHWPLSGRWSSNSHSSNDLVNLPETREVEMWGVVYADGSCGFYASEDFSLESAKRCNAFARIHIKRTVTEGEGL